MPLCETAACDACSPALHDKRRSHHDRCSARSLRHFSLYAQHVRSYAGPLNVGCNVANSSACVVNDTACAKKHKKPVNKTCFLFQLPTIHFVDFVVFYLFSSVKTLVRTLRATSHAPVQPVQRAHTLCRLTSFALYSAVSSIQRLYRRCETTDTPCCTRCCETRFRTVDSHTLCRLCTAFAKHRDTLRARAVRTRSHTTACCRTRCCAVLLPSRCSLRQLRSAALSHRRRTHASFTSVCRNRSSYDVPSELFSRLPSAVRPLDRRSSSDTSVALSHALARLSSSAVTQPLHKQTALRLFVNDVATTLLRCCASIPHFAIVAHLRSDALVRQLRSRSFLTSQRAFRCSVEFACFALRTLTRFFALRASKRREEIEKPELRPVFLLSSLLLRETLRFS